MKNKVKTKNLKHLIAIISIFIILLLCYFINYFIAMDAYASDLRTVVSVNKNIPPDSLQIKLQEAIDLVAASPDETNYIKLSYQYYMNAMYNECIWACQKSLEYNTNNYLAYNNMCSAYNQLGMWDAAIASGKVAFALIPGAQLVTNNLHVSVDGKAKLEKDLAVAEELVKTAPTEENYLNLGYLYYLSGSFELSISANNKVIDLNKKNIIAYNNICSAYNALGKYSDAETYCKKAIKIDSTFSLAKNNLKFAENNIKK
jgi:protein O-mannosyl-transferase